MQNTECCLCSISQAVDFSGFRISGVEQNVHGMDMLLYIQSSSVFRVCLLNSEQTEIQTANDFIRIGRHKLLSIKLCWSELFIPQF